MTLIDSHCHLSYPEFSDTRDDVVTRARSAGVGLMQTICTKMSEFDAVHDVARAYDDIYCSVGVHPHEAGKEPLVDVATLVKYASFPKVISIGETGLDYFYEHSERMVQQESFRRHINASRITQLPIIVHTRSADDDTIALLEEEYAKGEFPILIHCFTSTQRLADAVLAMGGYISISGIVTFKNAKELHETVRTVPLDHILIETDSPYLAPVPHRGSTNEPAFVTHVCDKVAELKAMSSQACAQATSNNFYRLFSKVVQRV